MYICDSPRAGEPIQVYLPSRTGFPISLELIKIERGNDGTNQS